MTAREMHYDFKQKLNKVDSEQYRNLKVPEIDWKLNEAQEVFVKIVAQPRLASRLGFEVNQRTVNDIRTIVVNQDVNNAIALSQFDENSYKGTLPPDFWFYAGSKVIATKGSCANKKLSTREVQHDDDHESSPFDRSSFEWGVANIRFNKDGIRIFTDGSFTLSKLVLDYLKKPKIIHNAGDFGANGYKNMQGETLTGMQNCELPEGVHREIVDLAVLITAGDLDLSNFSLKKYKAELTN